MINECEKNTMTKTGNNLRSSMLLTNNNLISQIKNSDFTPIIYKEIPNGEEWRVNLIKELIDVRHDRDMLQGFTYDEIGDLIELASIN